MPHPNEQNRAALKLRRQTKQSDHFHEALPFGGTTDVDLVLRYSFFNNRKQVLFRFRQVRAQKKQTFF